MARNLSHLTTGELAALAAPFENPGDAEGNLPSSLRYDYGRVYRTSKGRPYVRSEDGRARFISEAEARAIEKQNATLAAPFENPSSGPDYTRPMTAKKSLGRVDKRQDLADQKLLATEIALAGNLLGQLEHDDDDLVEEYSRVHSQAVRTLRERPERIGADGRYLKHLRGLVTDRYRL